MDELWAEREAARDDIGECAFWHQIERPRLLAERAAQTQERKETNDGDHCDE